jgi:O-antigen ligase
VEYVFYRRQVMYTNKMTRLLSSVYPISTAHQLELSEANFWGRQLTLLILAAWGIGLAVGFAFSLQVLTLAAFVAAITGLRWPTVGVFGMSILCTLDPVSRVIVLKGDGFWRYNTYNYWLLIVILLSLPLLVSFRDLHTRLLQGFLLLAGLEIGISGAWESGLQHLLNMITIFGLVVYFARARNNRNCWYWVGIINGTLGAAGGLLYYFQKTDLPEINSNAWSYFPLTAIFAICLSFSFIPHKHKLRSQIVLGSLALVNYVWVFLSGSRGSLAVATVAIMFLLIIAGRLSTRLLYTTLLVVVVALVSFVFTNLTDNAVSRIEKALDVDRSYVSRTSGRSDLALAAWYMFLDHPFGIGTGGFASTRIRQGYVEKTAGWQAENEMEAHAGWMKTLAENGIPGIVLEGAFVFSFAVIGWRRRRQGLFSLGLLVTLTLGLAFVTTEVQAKGLWFLAAGAIVLMHKKPTLRHFRVSERWPLARQQRPHRTSSNVAHIAR